MAVAPALFSPARAAAALETAERALLRPHALGVKTLDAADWAFRGAYDTAAEGDRATARGWNYHQGPEWLWPFGFYLRARLRFAPAKAGWASLDDARRWLHARLAPHRRHLEESLEGGLPELTQAGGAHCPASCVVQAWSSATLLDALHDLHVELAARLA
jgi:glycogen debranching enzyme